jgi:V/A-type H+-transporting ATPase subunit I
MKKVTLFISGTCEDLDVDLTRLGELGVMHVTPFKPADDESIYRVQARIKQMGKAIDILNQFVGLPETSGKKIDVEVFTDQHRGEIALMEKVLQIYDEYKYDQEALDKLNAAKEWYKTWGNVSHADIKALASKGLFLKLYDIPERELSKLKERDDITLAGMDNKVGHVILMATDKNEKLPFTEVAIPDVDFDSVDEKIAKKEKAIQGAKLILNALSIQRGFLQDALDERVRRFEVRNVQYCGEVVEGQIRYWKGYIPEKKVDNLTKTAEKNRWGYIIEDPAKEEADEIPTHIQSPRWAEKIRPVMNFMGLVPGYNEIDVSRVFMLFFTFFTGILVGDAGYGLVFILLTFIAHAKSRFKRKVEFQLVYTLSISILLWGVVSGTYFGSKFLAGIPFLNQLIVDQLASFGGDTIFVQKFMFLVGAIHLTIGHLQTAWKYINSVKAIAQLGWISIVWGLYLVVSQMVLEIPAPSFMIWLFVGGAVLVALFSQTSGGFFKGMLASIGNLPLSIINGFSDIISYIRLYAVGLATVLMAESFNEMAIGDGVTTVASGIGAVIILILGHGLNMILAVMAVIVHGVRLNMLEYAGHAGVEFSGSEYKPFHIKNQNNKQ